MTAQIDPKSAASRVDPDAEDLEPPRRLAARRGLVDAHPAGRLRRRASAAGRARAAGRAGGGRRCPCRPRSVRWRRRRQARSRRVTWPPPGAATSGDGREAAPASSRASRARGSRWNRARASRSRCLGELGPRALQGGQLADDDPHEEQQDEAQPLPRVLDRERVVRHDEEEVVEQERRRRRQPRPRGCRRRWQSRRRRRGRPPRRSTPRRRLEEGHGDGGQGDRRDGDGRQHARPRRRVRVMTGFPETAIRNRGSVGRGRLGRHQNRASIRLDTTHGRCRVRPEVHAQVLLHPAAQLR